MKCIETACINNGYPPGFVDAADTLALNKKIPWIAAHNRQHARQNHSQGTAMSVVSDGCHQNRDRKESSDR